MCCPNPNLSSNLKQLNARHRKKQRTQSSKHHWKSEYSISVNPRVVAGTQVAADISTNIPGSIEVMASLSLAGQSPKDTFIGATQRVTLADGTGQVNFDAIETKTGLDFLWQLDDTVEATIESGSGDSLKGELGCSGG